MKAVLMGRGVTQRGAGGKACILTQRVVHPHKVESLAKRILIAAGGVRVETCAYAAGARHASHHDRHSRITLTLRGAFHEDANAGAETFAPGDVLFKSRHSAHTDDFGPKGAALASIIFEDDAFPIDAWRPRRDAASLRLMLAALEAACANDAHAALSAAGDLAALDEAPARARPPAWLTHLRAELDALPLVEINVTARAAQAGVHPAHVSRLFRRCFGVSITEHAQSQSVRRALPLIAATPLSEAAIAAGFYDQSHMNRVFRRVIGRTPGAYRALLAQAG